jgi:hypothetical protein
MHPDKEICKIIDELLRKGVKRITELSDILERDHGIEIPPHFISEYNYRKRQNLEIRDDFFDFVKEKPEGTKSFP